MNKNIWQMSETLFKSLRILSGRERTAEVGQSSKLKGSSAGISPFSVKTRGEACGTHMVQFFPIMHSLGGEVTSS